jgi:hypothetical protein
MWSYLITDCFINPLPGNVENIPSDSESPKVKGNDPCSEDYFPSAITFDIASACVCPRKKKPGWKQPI